MIKRVKQFIRGMFARLSGKDYNFLTDYLTKLELDLFLSMSRYDCKHAVEVARYLADKGASLELVRAGLLHDIGKAECPELTLTRRSIAVFLEWRAPEDAQFLADRGRGKLAYAVYVHKNHPELGARILEGMNSNPHTIMLVRYHQYGSVPEEMRRDLEWLRDADERF